MKKKHSVLKGAVLLTAAGFIGRIIGFFYRIFLSRTIGARGVGIYQLIFPLYALSFSLTVSGIQTAVSHFVSAKTAAGDCGGARRIFHIGLAVSVALSLLVSCLLLRFHSSLALVFVKEPRSSELLRLLAYAVPFGSIHACINGYYYGLKQAKVPALVEVLEHAVRLGSVMLLVRIFTARGIAVTPAVAVYGVIAEEFFASLFSATALTWHFSSQPPLPKARYSRAHYAAELFALGTPLTLNRMLVNVLQSIEALLIPLQLRLFGLPADTALGTYGVLTGMALPLIMFPTALTSSICTMLLPVVSEAQATGRIRILRGVMRKLFLSCLLLGCLCFCFCFCLGDFLGNALFGNELAGAFIRALAWICPLFYLNPALATVLNGMGKTSRAFFNNLAGVGIRICFIVFGIPRFGVSAYFAGMLVNQLVLFVLGIREIKKSVRA